jgi:hypothetical protein
MERLQKIVLTNLLPNMPLFLSFDFCHAIKNARSLFLDHDMCSSEGVINSSYLKKLHTLQKRLPIKPVRFLTSKNIYTPQMLIK